MFKLIRVLLAYWKARRLKFDTREALDAYQNKQLLKHLNWLVKNSLYFSKFQISSSANKPEGIARPLYQFPLMNKEIMMEHFEDMNTAHLPLRAILDIAHEAEKTRDFSTTLEGYTVGLSSGTSAVRGAFLVSEFEKTQWAGVILANVLQRGLFAGERVALFLRADSGLYQAVRSPWITFQFFDLVSNFKERTQELEAYRPTIIVAPAQVLRQLALATLEEGVVLRPHKVISVAEVLEQQDRLILERAFREVHQVYQATEGLIASTCEKGTLHLNEEHLHIEREWLDTNKTKFVPIITDFTRTTQPIIRYRLNDVLVAGAPCSCGRVSHTLESIEGRCDDMLLLRAPGGDELSIFADAVSRILAQSLPLQADYRLTQTGPKDLTLAVQGTDVEVDAIRVQLMAGLATMGVDTTNLVWTLTSVIPPFNPTVKRRRITRQYSHS